MPPKWESAPIVKPADDVRNMPVSDARGAVEFAASVEPISPAQAAQLDLSREAAARAAANDRAAQDERERKRKELNETQSKGLGFYQRTRSADVEFERLGLDPQGYAELLATRTSPNYSRAGLSDERRAQLDAMENFIAASLRLESGAAIGPQEFDKQARIYFPMPGAGPKEIEQKRKQRELAIRGFRAIAGEYGGEQADAALRELGYIDEQGKPIIGTVAPDTGPLVTAPGTTRAAAISAITPGEPVMTDEDMAAGRAIQEAWNATGKFEDVARVAAQFNRSFREQDAAFLKANEGKPVNINANATGTPTATQEAVGEFVATPGGEMVAAGAVGAGNAATLGMLDELAPILGLDAQRVQMAKDYLRNKAPVSSFAGEMVGALPAMAAMSSGAGMALGGTRLASAAPMLGDVAFGAGLAGGEAPEGERALAALTGGAVAGAAGAAGRRVFGGGSSGAGGAGDGGMGPSGGPMGGMGGRSSVSAAATPDDLIRASKASGLGIDLMPFQASRSFKDMQRAHELAKNGEIGAPLRQRFGQQQAAIVQKFDDFIEGTGSEIRENLRGQGAKLTTALEKMAAKDKAKVRTLYNQAAKSVDAETPVPLSERVTIMQDGDDIDTTLIEWLNDQPTGVATSGITDSAKQFAARLGIAKIDPKTKELIPSTPTVKGMEKLRREISQVADGGDANLIRQKTVLKKLIDGHTEPYATGAYAKARAARREVAQKYEEVSTIAQLLGTKRNTPERVVAAEKVIERLISGNTSVANLQALRKLTTGEGGDPQAWKEVQGATLEYLRGKAYGAGNNVDEFGNPEIQVASFRNAVADLDKSGKLEELLGFEKAGAVRVMADVARDMFTAPKGSVNFSNTNSMWWNIADMLLNGALFQIPLPAGVLSNVLAPLKRTVKEAPLKKEVKQLIGEPTQ